jgi:SPX domain protein involved in polyphosphate accumulation
MKYIITEPQMAAISRFAEMYIRLDPYSRITPDGFYPIVSLYFDSPDLRLCNESLEGTKNRFKLRIRSYSDDPQSPCFFEIKRRMNAIIIKSRARTMRDDIETVLAGRLPSRANYRTNEDVLRQFQLYMQTVNAGPTVRVRYLRKAYEGDTDNRVRVTFDRQLAYNVGSASTIMLNGDGWRPHCLNGIILEIKFTGRYPLWLSQMAACFGLRAQSVSKYATSLKNSCLERFSAPKQPILKL